VVAGGAAADGVAAAGVAGGAVKGAVAGASDAGAANGVAVTGDTDVALLGCMVGPAANGGVAVEGIGMAGLAVATGSCEVMTFALPGGATTEVPSVVGTSASCRFAASRVAASRFAASRLRAAVACAPLGLNGGGSVGLLT